MCVQTDSLSMRPCCAAGVSGSVGGGVQVMLRFCRRLVWFIFRSCEDGPKDLQATLAQHSDSPAASVLIVSVSVVVVSLYTEPAPRLFIADKTVFPTWEVPAPQLFQRRVRLCTFLPLNCAARSAFWNSLLRNCLKCTFD